MKDVNIIAVHILGAHCDLVLLNFALAVLPDLRRSEPAIRAFSNRACNDDVCVRQVALEKVLIEQVERLVKFLNRRLRIKFHLNHPLACFVLPINIIYSFDMIMSKK
ncbi:hypothetical protein D3C81_2048020 [compost metagenome]